MPHPPLLSDTAKNVLVRITARTDALWWPTRDCRAACWGSVWEARWNYHTAGLPWASGTSNNADAHAASRALEELHRLALVRRLRTRGLTARTTQTILTPAGDRAAGWLIGEDRERIARRFCRELRRLSVERTGEPFAWIPETSLNGERGWGDGHSIELANVAGRYFPAALRGWAQTNSTTQRHAGYQLLPAGVEAADEPDGEPFDEQIDDELADEFWSLYLAAFDNAVDEWTSRIERTQEIGEIPLAPHQFAFAKTESSA